MIRVWSDGQPAGALARFRDRGTSFSYDRLVDPRREISLTMPVQPDSWNQPFGILPIFEMNLPEGALREKLRLQFAKATGSVDEFDLLGIVGRTQLGRIRYTGMEEMLDDAVPFQSIDEILQSRRGGDYYRYLLEQFAAYSGINGVQPKILIRDDAGFGGTTHASTLHDSFRGATHIVKFWDAAYPQLAANEFFCLRAAEACGLAVPRHQLAHDAGALVIERFDLRTDGTYLGFEDFCVLNAKRTDQKYQGSYETAIVKRFGQFADLLAHRQNLDLFKLIVLNCALRNGDAHLKNFGVLYEEVQGEARLAPVYDLVTTAAYMAQDQMALTLNGSPAWPAAKQLTHFGESRLLCSPREVRDTLHQVAEAVAETSLKLKHYMVDHAEFVDVGTRMLKQWAIGTESLRLPAKG